MENEKSLKLNKKTKAQKVHRSGSELAFKIVSYAVITLFALLCLYPPLRSIFGNQQWRSCYLW